MEAEIARKSENEVKENLNAFQADFGSSASSSQTLSCEMEAEDLIEPNDEVTQTLDARGFNPPLDVSDTLLEDFGQSTSTTLTLSYKTEAEALRESTDDVSESLDARVVNPPLNVSAAALPANFVPSTSTSQTFSYAMEAEALIESRDNITEYRCARVFNSSMDVSTTFVGDLEPSVSSSQTLTNKMETEGLIESKDEVIECLDARMFNPPRTLMPAVPADIGPSTSSSQTSSTELSTGNPDSQKGWLFPAKFKPSKIFSQTPPIEQITHPNPQKGFPFPLPTKTVQNPVPKITEAPRFQITRYFPNRDASSYELEKFKENRMIIFDHDEFLSGPPRPGTEKDEKLLRETFEKFRFKIDPTYKNLYMSPLLATVKKFAIETDFSMYGCICVAILTHGHTQPGFLKAYDRRYSEYDILKYFDASQNRTLAAKPIIFIIQACRGAQPASKISTGGKTPAPQLDHGEDGENYHLPTEADRIVFHSSYVGKASVRDPENGSWFIQTLCKKIKEHASNHDLETIFKMVRRAVALDCDTEEDWKQMPVVTSTTLRELYLAPNHPRSSTDEQPRPASPYVLVCQTSDSDEHPVSDQLAEQLNEHVCRRESTETITVPGTSEALKQLRHLPCCCFLEYFEYMKNCLESFSHRNKEDLVAKNLLKLVERAGSGSEYNLQKFEYIQSMWEHFETYKNNFPPDSFSFVHRMHMPLNAPETQRLEPL